jgi:hypothetical protein
VISLAIRQGFSLILGGCGIEATATLATLDVFDSKMSVVIR